MLLAVLFPDSPSFGMDIVKELEKRGSRQCEICGLLVAVRGC